MLETATRLFRHQGFQSTSLVEVFEKSALSGGSPNDLFPGGKEELGVEVVARAAYEMADFIHHAGTRASDPGAMLRNMTRIDSDSVEESQLGAALLVLTMAIEAWTSEPLRTACSTAYLLWQRMLQDALIATGVLAPSPDALANHIISAILGALAISRAHNSVTQIVTTTEQLVVLLNSVLEA
jgi:TetR/AcrR family transcriptional repressor of lmrAB and yxaGH operons